VPVRIRYLAVAAATAAPLLLAGCSSAGQPLASGSQQEGMKVCVPAPNPGDPSNRAWNSVVAYPSAWYYNPSHAPVDIESVSLLGSHNLVLRAVTVYEMRHDEHPLQVGGGWGALSHGADPVAWAKRQGVPGAVIPPEPSSDGPPKPGTRDEYEVVVGVAAVTPKGGWAIGQQVTYRQGNREYTIRTYTGYGIAPPGKANQPRCDAEMAAITGAWPAP
jgi:hypothetical protein